MHAKTQYSHKTHNKESHVTGHCSFRLFSHILKHSKNDVVWCAQIQKICSILSLRLLKQSHKKHKLLFHLLNIQCFVSLKLLCNVFSKRGEVSIKHLSLSEDFSSFSHTSGCQAGTFKFSLTCGWSSLHPISSITSARRPLQSYTDPKSPSCVPLDWRDH